MVSNGKQTNETVLPQQTHGSTYGVYQRVGFLPFENGILQTTIFGSILHRMAHHTPVLDENREISYSTIC